MATGRRFVFMALLGALVAAGAMERALITHDFSVPYVADNGSPGHAGPLQRRHAVGRARGLDPALDADPRRLPHGRPCAFRGRVADPLVGWATLVSSWWRPFFFGLMLGPANPFRPISRADPLRRAGPQPAAAEPPADGVPSADALPRLRGLHDAVRVRRSPRWSPAGSARAGWSRRGAGRCSPGGSSRSASCSAPGGATRCSAGAATGRGTRSRTPRSCRGSPAPPTCTR